MSSSALLLSVCTRVKEAAAACANAAARITPWREAADRSVATTMCSSLLLNRYSMAGQSMCGTSAGFVGPAIRA